MADDKIEDGFIVRGQVLGAAPGDRAQCVGRLALGESASEHRAVGHVRSLVSVLAQKLGERYGPEVAAACFLGVEDFAASQEKGGEGDV